jgi:hypothetical protein
MLKKIENEEKERIEKFKEILADRKRKQMETHLHEAATKIQRAFRRKLEGRTLMQNLRDVIKRLMEAEKAKIKLFDTLETMQEEMSRFYNNYLMKNIDVRFIQVIDIFLENYFAAIFLQRQIGWKIYGETLRRLHLVNKIGRKADKLLKETMK